MKLFSWLKRDWAATGATRWKIVKRQGDFLALRRQLEQIDMNSGEKRWVFCDHPISRKVMRTQSVPLSWTVVE